MQSSDAEPEEEESAEGLRILYLPRALMEEAPQIAGVAETEDSMLTGYPAF